MKPNQPCNYLNRGHKSKVNIFGQYDNISRVVIKHVFKVSTESNTNQTVQLVKVDS